MIIVAIIALASIVIYFLMPFFGNIVTAVPSSVAEGFAWMAPYLVDGVRFVNCFIDPVIWRPLLSISIAYTSVLHGYKFALWFIHKIPMLSVD